MFSQGLNPVTLGGVMAGGEVVDPQFPRRMDRRFGDLAGDEGIQTQLRSLSEVALSGPRAPTDAADRVRAAGDVRVTVVELVLAVRVVRGTFDFAQQQPFATELGVQAIRPVTTRRSIAERVRTDRFTLIAREAAEQSERLDLPVIAEPEPLARVLDRWAETDGPRRLLFLDEAAGGEGSPWRRVDAGAAPALKALEALCAADAAPEPGSWAVLIGPEGGFDPEERERLRGSPFVTAALLLRGGTRTSDPQGMAEFAVCETERFALANAEIAF